jgi:hypothetical protein
VRERVSLAELPTNERGPILRAFWHQVPQGRPFIARLFGLAADSSAEDVEAAAPRCPVFRIGQIAVVQSAATPSSDFARNNRCAGRFS